VSRFLFRVEFDSSPIQNPAVARIKLEAQVVYRLSFGCLNTHWKDNSEIFPIDLEPYYDSLCASLNGRNKSRVVLSLSQIGVVCFLLYSSLFSFVNRSWFLVWFRLEKAGAYIKSRTI